VPASARESRAAYLHGLDLYNRGQFFECHEALEEIWREAAGPERLFLQSLIHFAVAFHHHGRQNPMGALLQLGKGLRKLAGYLPEYGGLDTWRLYQEGREAFRGIRAGGLARPPAMRPRQPPSG